MECEIKGKENLLLLDRIALLSYYQFSKQSFSAKIISAWQPSDQSLDKNRKDQYRPKLLIEFEAKVSIIMLDPLSVKTKNLRGGNNGSNYTPCLSSHFTIVTQQKRSSLKGASTRVNGLNSLTCHVISKRMYKQTKI